MEPGDPWLPRRMRQYVEVVAAERDLGPEVEKALTQVLAEARKHAGRSWAGRTRFWATVLATVLFGPLAGLFVHRFTQEVAHVKVSIRPDPQEFVDAFLKRVEQNLASWPDQILAEIDREQADGGDVDALLDITAPNRRLRAEVERLQRTADDPDTRASVRREARARLAALHNRLDEHRREDSQWWPWVAGAVRNLVLSALNGGTHDGSDAAAEATGEPRFKQWWSMQDSQVRTAHRHAHGQVRPMGESFMVGGFHMRYPGDPEAPADLVVGCRCSLLSLSAAEAARARRRTHAIESGREAAGESQGGVSMTAAIEIHDQAVPEDELPPLLAAGTTLPEDQTTLRWSGVLAPLGVRSGDNRMLMPPEGDEFDSRDLPLPLMYMEKTGPGHDNAVVVGRIDHAWVEDGNLMGAGVFDLHNDTAREAVRQIDGGFHRWVSVRVDKATRAFAYYRGDELLDPSTFDTMEGADVQIVPSDVEEVEVAERWRLMNAVIVAEPAFQEAVIGLYEDDSDLGGLADDAPAAQSVAASAEDDEDGEFADMNPAQRLKGRPKSVKPSSDPAADHPTQTPVDDPSKVEETPQEEAGETPAEEQAEDAGEDPNAPDPDASADAQSQRRQPPPWLRKKKTDGGAKPEKKSGNVPPWARGKQSITATGDVVDEVAYLNGDRDCPMPFDGTQRSRELMIETARRMGMSVEFAPSQGKRDAAESKGHAMPGGRYPVETEDDLKKAIRAVGRAGGSSGTEADRAAVRRHVIAQAKRLGKSDLVPDNWNSNGSLKAALVDAHAPYFAALVASAGPLRPPTEWFTNPGLRRPTPLTIGEDGRVYGHVAVWGNPHVGYPGRRVCAPRGADYSRFHHGVVRTRDDQDIAVGTIVLGADHAPVDRETTVAEAMAHYAHSGYGVAIVRAGEDEHGVWVNGAICPDVDELRLAALRRCSLSGDWRTIDGKVSFIGALAVNVPGFPTPREQTDAQGTVTALVAAGALRQPAETRSAAAGAINVSVSLSQESAQEFARNVFSELSAMLTEARATREESAVESPAPTATPDRAAQVAEFQARMNRPKVEKLARRMAGRKAGV